MEKLPLSVPNEKKQEYGYGLAWKLAVEQLAGIEDIEQQCRKCGAGYRATGSEQVITIKYLNRLYQITLPGIDISLADSGEEVPIRERILLLHYFIQAKGTPLTGKILAYKELPGGDNYLPTYQKRAIKPLTDRFGNEPHGLVDIAGLFGGRKADYGDAAVTIDAFSKVPITIVLWRGDEELAPTGNMLFDSSITDYLTTDDINVLCETLAWKLARSRQQP